MTTDDLNTKVENTSISNVVVTEIKLKTNGKNIMNITKNMGNGLLEKLKISPKTNIKNVLARV